MKNIIDVLRELNITTNITKPVGNQIQTWTVQGAHHNRQESLNWVLSLELCQLSLEVKILKQTSLLPIHPCFSILGLGRPPPPSYQNFSVLETLSGIFKSLMSKSCPTTYQPTLDIFFSCWGYGLTTRKKLLKVI